MAGRRGTGAGPCGLPGAASGHVRLPRRRTQALDLRDDGFVNLNDQSAADFLAACAALRFWPRQASITEKASAAMATTRKR